MSATTEFETQLKEIVGAKRLSASKMQKLTELAMANMQHDSKLVSTLYRTHKALPASSKVNSLYAFDALARAAKSHSTKKGLVGDINAPVGNSATFLLKLEGVLDGLFLDLATATAQIPEIKEKSRKVLDIWTKGTTFPAHVLVRLQDLVQEKKDVDSAVVATPTTAVPEAHTTNGAHLAALQTISSPPQGHAGTPPLVTTSSSPPPLPTASLQSVLALLGQANNGPSMQPAFNPNLPTVPTSAAAPPVAASLGSALALIQQLAGKQPSASVLPQQGVPIPLPIPAFNPQAQQQPPHAPPGFHIPPGGHQGLPQPPFPPRPPAQFQNHSGSQQQFQQQQQYSGSGYGTNPSYGSHGDSTPPTRGRWTGAPGPQNQNGREWQSQGRPYGGREEGEWRGRGFDRGRGRGGWRGSGRGGGPPGRWSGSRSPSRSRSPRGTPRSTDERHPRSRSRSLSRERSRSPRRRFDGPDRRGGPVRPYSPPRRPSNPAAAGPMRGREEITPAVGKDEFGRDIVPRSGSASPPRNGATRAGTTSVDDEDTLSVDMEMGTPDPEEDPSRSGGPPASAVAGPSSSSANTASALPPTSTASNSSAGLQDFDFRSFDASNPASWQALAAAWQVTNGTTPTQEQLLSMMMNGGGSQQQQEFQQQSSYQQPFQPQQIKTFVSSYPDEDDDNDGRGWSGGQRGGFRGRGRGGFRGRGRGGYGGGGGGGYGGGNGGGNDDAYGTDVIVLGGGDG